MWRFAKGHRRPVVLFLCMSAVANIILLTQPLVFGEFLNEIQRNGFGEHNITYLVLILLSLLGIELGFWMFHGPSRVIENLTAFRTERSYRQHLLSGVLGLGLSWHDCVIVGTP
jgi:ATP-binding cassette, subfamily B, bacterial